MNTEEDWKRERELERGCRYCHGSGWRPATYASGPTPCGCDEPQEDETDAVGMEPEGRNETQGTQADV